MVIHDLDDLEDWMECPTLTFGQPQMMVENEGESHTCPKLVLVIFLVRQSPIRGSYPINEL